MITLKVCPNCDSDQIAPYFQIGTAPLLTSEIVPGVKVEVAVITHYSLCQNCRLIFQNPRMSDKELNKYYSKGYYRKQLNLTDKQIDEDEAYRTKVDLVIIKKFIGDVKSHLDLGGSRGYLLEAVGADQKVVVEPNVSYPKVNGVKVYPEMNKVTRKSFDLVTAIHVLEHVPKPLDYLKRMTKYVGKNGYLVVEVPTWKSPGGPLRLAHLSHFEPSVLRHMCLQVGLNIVHEEFTPHFLLICQLDQ